MKNVNTDNSYYDEGDEITNHHDKKRFVVNGNNRLLWKVFSFKFFFSGFFNSSLFIVRELKMQVISLRRFHEMSRIVSIVVIALMDVHTKQSSHRGMHY
jgi:hypothetical protein